MSVKALTWAFEQPISATDKVVLLALADHANDLGMCWPSISILMQRAHVGERTVQRAIQSLEDGGFLTRERRKRDNGSDTSNLYRLNMGEQQRTPADASVGRRGAKLTPPKTKGEGVTQTGGEGVIQTGGEGGPHDTPRTVRKNRKKEPSKDISSDSDFEAFWAAYPKRPNNPKAAARLKYKLARSKGVSHETMLTAVERYAASRKGEDPKFTAMAVTWLNQRRWEDDDTWQSPDENATVNTSLEFKKLCNAFPVIGNLQAASDAYEAALRSNASPIELGDAASKYRLLRKARGDDPAFDIPLSRWLKGRLWLDMRDYEFYRTGMNNTPSVRLKKEKRK